MITDFDKILNDLSYKVKDGIPDLTNEQHAMKNFHCVRYKSRPLPAYVDIGC